MAKRQVKGEGSHWQLPDGTWRGYVTLPGTGGKRRYVSGKTQREVIAKKRKQLAELAGGLDLVAGKITLGAYLQKWLDTTVKPSRSPITYRTYEGQCRLHIYPTLGHVRLQDLTSQQIQQWVTERHGYKPRSVRISYLVLHTALRQAVRWHMLPRNPADDIALPKLVHVEIKYWTPEQARAFLQQVSGSRLEALYALGLGLGLRRSELLGLAWDAVDLDKGALTVKRTLQRLGTGLTMLEPKTKGARRTLTLPSFIHGLLKERRVAYLQERLQAGPEWQGDKWNTVFSTLKGLPVQPSHLAVYFDRQSALAGLPRITIHGMRHTAATLMLSQVVNIKTVSNILGHASISTTLDIYGHVLDSMHQSAAEAIDRVLGIAG